MNEVHLFSAVVSVCSVNFKFNHNRLFVQLCEQTVSLILFSSSPFYISRSKKSTDMYHQ